MHLLRSSSKRIRQLATRRRPKQKFPSFAFLPADILLMIVKYLITPHFHTLPFVHGGSIWTEDAGESTPIANTYHVLRTLNLVCRSWNDIIGEFLFARPVFMSGRGLRRFKNTLVQSGELRPFVKEVALLDTARANSSSKRFRKQRGPYTEADILSVLTSSPNLDAVALSFHSASSMPLGRVILSQVGNRLCKLSIYGSALEATFSSLSFPLLEILCLRHCRLDNKPTFPLLPRLHTLKLAQLYSEINLEIFLHPLRASPSLRTVELYHNEAFSEMSLEDLPSLFGGLFRLHFVGDAELKLCDLLMRNQALHAVQCLAIGVMNSSNHPISAWTLPQTLHTLSVFSAILPSRYWSSTVAEGHSLTSIRHFLESNKDVLKLSELKRIRVGIESNYADGDIMRLDNVKGISKAITEFCQKNSLEVEFDTLSTSPPSLTDSRSLL